MNEVAALTAACPIRPETLSTAVQRSVGAQTPVPVRLMAARGMAPMPPKDLVTAQFVLTFDADEKVRQAAEKSLANLDERIANAVLSDTNVDKHVLGYLAVALATKDAFAEKLLLNPGTPSEAFVEVAKVASENICEIIANNQARLLEQPEIARSLSKNTHALRSTIDRVVDFLVRSSIVLEDLAEFEDALLRLTGEERLKAADAVELDADMIDEKFLTEEQKKQLESQGRKLIDEESDDASEPSEEEKQTVEQRMRNMNIGQLVALATKGKKEYRRYLLRHTNRIIALAAITSPATKENDVVAAAQSRMVAADVINYIANKKDWVRMYAVKLALVQNPKTLLPTAMKLTTVLNKKDLKILAKSRNIPGGVKTLALKLSREND